MRLHPAALVALVAAVVLGAWLLLRRRPMDLAELGIVDMAPAFGGEAVRQRKGTPRMIVIHHSATATPQATRRVLRQKELSTHFEVDQAGRIYRYLDPATTVALHAKSASGWANSDSIGIDVTHVTDAPFTEAQVAATARLVRALGAKFGMPGGVAPDGVFYEGRSQLPAKISVVRHRNVRKTECPQDFPMHRLGPVIGGAKVA